MAKSKVTNVISKEKLIAMCYVTKELSKGAIDNIVFLSIRYGKIFRSVQ